MSLGGAPSLLLVSAVFHCAVRGRCLGALQTNGRRGAREETLQRRCRWLCVVRWVLCVWFLQDEGAWGWSPIAGQLLRNACRTVASQEDTRLQE